jgi:hypothetical protein
LIIICFIDSGSGLVGDTITKVSNELSVNTLEDTRITHGDSEQRMAKCWHSIVILVSSDM